MVTLTLKIKRSVINQSGWVVIVNGQSRGIQGDRCWKTLYGAVKAARLHAMTISGTDEAQIVVDKRHLVYMGGGAWEPIGTCKPEIVTV